VDRTASADGAAAGTDIHVVSKPPVRDIPPTSPTPKRTLIFQRVDEELRIPSTQTYVEAGFATLRVGLEAVFGTLSTQALASRLFHGHLRRGCSAIA
jgi:hypothetical protein